MELSNKTDALLHFHFPCFASLEVKELSPPCFRSNGGVDMPAQLASTRSRFPVAMAPYTISSGLIGPAQPAGSPRPVDSPSTSRLSARLPRSPAVPTDSPSGRPHRQRPLTGVLAGPRVRASRVGTARTPRTERVATSRLHTGVQTSARAKRSEPVSNRGTSLTIGEMRDAILAAPAVGMHRCSSRSSRQGDQVLHDC